MPAGGGCWLSAFSKGKEAKKEIPERKGTIKKAAKLKKSKVTKTTDDEYDDEWVQKTIRFLREASIGSCSVNIFRHVRSLTRTACDLKQKTSWAMVLRSGFALEDIAGQSQALCSFALVATH